ncbi:RNA polymerase sigma-70 factor (sigma-E family) [Asanoa ferruginea]|uniref:RNA polymerase sigma-70 factor (Sigma-E family) n=1 Tax=Asanoa ferruginea TaxID=53367 RepID=A0A3D9ZGG8_9ACTN|nr:SigE family RNA polymerase sigma factor [Asanoa ferruginea]REF96496.1 RNA polymerase sigma-70 factor (sigma-E family) [Asanoa ferruginea]GIF53203.1 RNA polymerase subunit sigma-24 [Asanoa ferruginea]
MTPLTYEEFADVQLGAMLRYAVMLCGDPHLAQDLVQETMVRVQLNWRKVARADAPDRYVRRMITNQYLDWRRGSWLRRVLLRAEPDEASRVSPVDHAQTTADRDQIWTWLARLPKAQRAALVLRYYEDLPDAEIAEILGCAVGTVRSSISRALATLRAEMVETCP